MEIHALNIRLRETEARGLRQQCKSHVLHHGAVLHAGELTQSSLHQARLPSSVTRMGLNAKHIVSSFASWRCKLEKHAKTLQVAGDLYLILLRNTKRLWVCASGSRGRPANPQHMERCYSKFYLVVAEDLRSYKILHIDPNHDCTHVLDSTKNAWETRDGRSPPSFHLRMGQGAVYMGVLCAVCMQS